MRRHLQPALIVHGGAGALGPAHERPARRRGMLAAVERGAGVLREGGSALDAVLAAVMALEDDPWFNAGYGSVLNAAGRVEMDASLMVFPAPTRPGPSSGSQDNRPGAMRPGAGAVAAVSRVRNPIMLARAVMDYTPHLLMVGAGAERLARLAALKRCRPEQLVTPRARERWRAFNEREAAGGGPPWGVGPRLRGTAAGNGSRVAGEQPPTGGHGTVGAVALDARGQLAAATSTGGITGKLPGRVGDSAIFGAGTFADPYGAASATGLGEAIVEAALCREAVRALRHTSPARAALGVIARLRKTEGAEAGIIMVDRRGRLGYVHNAESMEVALFEPSGGIRGFRLEPATAAASA